MAKNPKQKKLTNQDFTVRLSRLVVEARELGLYHTAVKLHEAVQAVGWEIEGKLFK